MSLYASCRLCGVRAKLVADAGGSMKLPEEWTMHDGKACCPACSEARPDVSLLPRQRGQATTAIIDQLRRSQDLRDFVGAVISKSKNAPAAARTAVLEAVNSRMSMPEGPLRLLLCDVLTSADWHEVVRVMFQGVETGAPEAAGKVIDKLMDKLKVDAQPETPPAGTGTDPFSL